MIKLMTTDKASLISHCRQATEYLVQAFLTIHGKAYPDEYMNSLTL